MKTRISHALAALLLAGAIPLAHSQVAPPAGLVEEPAASVSREDSMANTIAQALNADPSLKHSKMTVQPIEGGTILLTGSALTELQRVTATKIARQYAGEDKVVNTIASDELVIAAPTPQPAADETPATLQVVEE